MKNLVLVALAILGIAFAGCSPTKVDTRDYDYEQYCDSVWENNPDYYLDVIVESDEYQNYIEQNGEWF